MGSIADGLLHFETRATQRGLGRKSRPNFGLLTPPSVNIRRGMGEMSECDFQLEPTGSKFPTSGTLMGGVHLARRCRES